MKIIKRFTGFFALALALCCGFVSNASAALVLTGVTFPMTDIEAVAVLILAAAAAIWVIKKILTLIKAG